MSIEYIDKAGTFSIENPENTSYLYFPLTNEGGIMNSITPNLSGDSKTGQNAFLLEPVSSEDLHTSTMSRNVWCKINGETIWSVGGVSPMQQFYKSTDKGDRTKLQAGKLWHQMERENTTIGIAARILNYCPATDEKVEIMKVTFENISQIPMLLTPTVAIPIYGRSADNIRDHRHVTSLLHCIETKEEGILVTPVLSFDERGHKSNSNSYGIFARGEYNEKPIGFYPVLEEFIGEGGTLHWPKAVVTDDIPCVPSGTVIKGYEAMGGIKFGEVILQPKESKSYQIVLSYDQEGLKYLDNIIAEEALKQNKLYWEKQSAVECESGIPGFDALMGWVGIQPTLRRIYGCSFLPHHDYGRGGRGFRDLWQDCLALILKDPESVRAKLLSYYGGVRMDGSNATIIGSKPGEFIADRNSIVRVWMDHGLWPWITTALYLNRTGDVGFLFEENTYFKDKVSHRGTGRDELWDGDNQLKTEHQTLYKGTVLEHILVQNLTMFYDVGIHNHMKLLGGDWNDALDMAKEYGESVAFTAAYSGNLLSLSEMLAWARQERHINEVQIAAELQLLLDQSETIFESEKRKQNILNQYLNACASKISGDKIKISIEELEHNLRAKAKWIQNHIRKTEWVGDGEGQYWFNGYYDNDKNQVEGKVSNNVRIMLTSQVFAIMSGTATAEQVVEITKAVDKYLYDAGVGGYRLNTDFKELKMNLGRMFGFAYGHKENGAVFSHMAVMYAYSLYNRDFVKEGYQVIKALYNQISNFDVSCIYPGIPEYFNPKGRGMYHYLTGAASWLVLTVLTEMFGVKGTYGHLDLIPKLTLEQFDEEGKASITCRYANLDLRIIYENTAHKEIGDYEIEEIQIDHERYSTAQSQTIQRINLTDLQKLESGRQHIIHVLLA